MSDSLARADAFVIGGGISGLAAATQLTQSGMRVVVFEARGTCGGRATSFDDPLGGPPIDNGQHALMGCYHETFDWLHTIGSRDLVRVDRALSVHVVDGRGARSTLSCPPWPSPLQLLAGVARWRAVPLRERAQLARLAPPLLRARAAVAAGRSTLPVRDDESVREWLRRHGQGPRLTALLWEPLAVAALNQPIDVAAARPFVRVLGQLLGAGQTDASIALPTVPLRSIFADPAVRWLEAHGSSVQRHAIAHVDVRDGRATRITRRGAETIDLGGRPVIVAVPWHVLPRAITGDTSALAPTLRAAHATRAAAIVSVNLWFDRDVLDVPMLGFEARRFQWAFAREGYVAMVMSGAEPIVRLDNDAIVAIAIADLRDAVPAARQAAPTRALVLREPRATFSLAPAMPPRPQCRTRVEGLFLAGDWVDTHLPATIEGAVAAGRRAASEIAAR